MSFESPKGASILILISFFPLGMDRGWILFFGFILHFSFLFTRFGSVDYTKNADGTITLIVDGVWPDYNSDLAFRNTVVVQPFEDGTFRYLSNSIEQIELELPPIARTKG